MLFLLVTQQLALLLNVAAVLGYLPVYLCHLASLCFVTLVHLSFSDLGSTLPLAVMTLRGPSLRYAIWF